MAGIHAELSVPLAEGMRVDHEDEPGLFASGAATVGLARDSGADRLYVRSAAGTREYYARLGFVRADPDMVKRW